MRLGVTLPSFTDDAGALVEAAEAAEAAGLDGVFVFDHLYPIGQPERPALSAGPMLGAVAARTSRVRLGPLVARIGLWPDDVVLSTLGSLQALSHGRLLAGLGIGDAQSRGENVALGIEFRPVAERRLALGAALDELAGAGIECQVGALSPATQAVARRRGVAVNLWGVTDDVVAAAAAEGEATWAGPIDGDADAAAARLTSLAAAGASWAIWGWPSSLDLVQAAAALAGIGRDND